MSQNNTIGTKSNFQNTDIPVDQKLSAEEFNQVTAFQKQPVQTVAGSLADTNIVIDGTKSYATTIVVTGATRTITAALTGHTQGNNIKQRYQFDVDCTITLTDFESTGNNTGDITPITAGTYDFKFNANARGINLIIPQNLIKETIKVPIGPGGTDHTVGTPDVGIHIDWDFYLESVNLGFNPIATGEGPTGSSFIVDINVADIDGASLATILSTKLSVDAGGYHSSTASVPAVISTNVIDQYKFISIDIDQIGSTLAGQAGFVTLIGYRT